MAITFKSFQDFVNDMIARWQGDTGITAVLVSGDPLLAAFDAGATQFIFIENLLQQVVNMARLSTSSGSDVDTFLSDFGLTRLPATFATGQVVFTTASPASAQIVIPAGTIVQTNGGAVQYQTVADTTLPGWNATLNGYVIQQGQTTVTATVKAVSAGALFNVQPNLLVQMGISVSGIASVTNPAAILNGLNAESDSAAKARFVLFIASLSKATSAAIMFAVTTVQQGLDVVLLENLTPNLQQQFGFFTVVVDDGSGSPPSSLLTAVSNAVNATRAFTIPFTVIPPVLLANTPIIINIHSSSPSTSIPLVQAAVLAYVNNLIIGQPLNVARLIQVALDADPNISDIGLSTTLINGVNADLVPLATQLIRTSTSAITVTSF